MDAAGNEQKGVVVQRVDLTQFDLPVLAANAAEAAAHVEVIAQIDKTSGGKAIWKEAA